MKPEVLPKGEKEHVDPCVALRPAHVHKIRPPPHHWEAQVAGRPRGPGSEALRTIQKPASVNGNCEPVHFNSLLYMLRSSPQNWFQQKFWQRWARLAQSALHAFRQHQPRTRDVGYHSVG